MNKVLRNTEVETAQTKGLFDVKGLKYLQTMGSKDKPHIKTALTDFDDYYKLKGNSSLVQAADDLTTYKFLYQPSWSPLSNSSTSTTKTLTMQGLLSALFGYTGRMAGGTPGLLIGGMAGIAAGGVAGSPAFARGAGKAILGAEKAAAKAPASVYSRGLSTELLQRQLQDPKPY